MLHEDKRYQHTMSVGDKTANQQPLNGEFIDFAIYDMRTRRLIGIFIQGYPQCLDLEYGAVDVWLQRSQFV